MKTKLKALALALAMASSVSAHAGVITAYSDLASFNAAVGALAVIVEDFTGSSHFPISSGILNAATNEAGITPGTIQPGVTYSTPLPGNGNFFNIDAGGGFSGGFLDTVTGNGRVLTIAFDNDVQFFAFDTNALVGASGMQMTVNFISGSPFQQQIIPANGSALDFFGFGSDAADIGSITLSGPGTFSFAIDNFRFTAGSNNQNGNVPEPATIALMGLGFAGLVVMRRRKTA